MGISTSHSIHVPVRLHYGMSVELRNFDQRVAKIEGTLQQLANVVVMTVRQDERLIAIERRVDRLEHTSPRTQP
jgi:hypothetical protein